RNVGRWLCADRACDQGRQTGNRHQQRNRAGALTEEFKEFTRLFTSPPKSPCGYVEDPNYPKLTEENARSPRAFSFCGVMMHASIRDDLAAHAVRSLPASGGEGRVEFVAPFEYSTEGLRRRALTSPARSRSAC